MTDPSCSITRPSFLQLAARLVAASVKPLRRRSVLFTLVRLSAAVGMMTSCIPQGSCRVTCKPILAIDEVRLSEVQSSQRTWTAIVVADGSYCATSSGTFEIDFVRLKETAPDLQFTEQFRWTSGRFEVSVMLWADEAIFDHRIGFIAPCVCRDLPLRLTDRQ